MQMKVYLLTMSAVDGNPSSAGFIRVHGPTATSHFSLLCTVLLTHADTLYGCYIKLFYYTYIRLPINQSIKE